MVSHGAKFVLGVNRPLLRSKAIRATSLDRGKTFRKIYSTRIGPIKKYRCSQHSKSDLTKFELNFDTFLSNLI
jgi:hypothetical protein